MSNPIPFRNLRQTLMVINAECAMLLAVEGLEWSKMDYSMFLVMTEMWKKRDNPTYNQMLVFVGAWLRFLKRLIAQLPEGDLKANSEVEFSKVSTGFEELVT